MAQPPLVSVVIPTYRRPQYLIEAIQSVVAQDFQDWRLVVHDDGATAENRAIVEGFGDARIVHRVNPRRLGIGANKFSGWQAANGRYVANLDDDDVWAPHFLSTLVPVLEANPSVVIAFGSPSIIDAHGDVDAEATASNEATYRGGLAPGRHEPLDRLLLIDKAIPLTMGSVIRRECIDWQDFPPETDVVADFWLGYLLVRSGGAAFYVRQNLTRYRVHGASATAAGGVAWHESFAACHRLMLRDPQLWALWPEFRSRLGAHERQAALCHLVAGDAPAARRSCRRAMAVAVTPATIAVAAISLFGPAGRRAVAFLRCASDPAPAGAGERWVRAIRRSGSRSRRPWRQRRL